MPTVILLHLLHMLEGREPILLLKVLYLKIGHFVNKTQFMIYHLGRRIVSSNLVISKAHSGDHLGCNALWRKGMSL